MMKPSTNNSRDYIRFCFDLYREALHMAASGDSLEAEWVQVTKRMWLQAANPYRTRCGNTPIRFNA